MSVQGFLQTMALSDLLQWASVNKKTGILELERNKVRKRITFREGRIVACAADDPRLRIGQFLLSRGRITRGQLREALARQETTRESLGLIFQDMGLLTREVVEAQVAAKAEEILYGLFDWPDAVFRFREISARDPFIIEVDFAVQDVLLEGIRRHDELRRIRAKFRGSGVVLARTSRPMPAALRGDPLAPRVLELVDGERTIAEVLLRARASEFDVVKLLFTLYRDGVLAVRRSLPPDPEMQTIVDVVPTELEASAKKPPSQRKRAGVEELARERAARERRVESAVSLMSRGEHRQALEIVGECSRDHPDDHGLRQLLHETEAAYVAAARAKRFRGSLVPMPVPTPAKLAANGLQPTELFLLSLLDGKMDVQSLTWVAPLREVDLLLSLERLADHGLIELREPELELACDEEIPDLWWSAP